MLQASGPEWRLRRAYCGTSCSMSNHAGTARIAGLPADLDGVATRHERLTRWLLFLGYIAIVVFTAAHHEMWRDEVRALSVAQDGSLPELFGELKYEGHPAVWYLLLRTGYLLTGSRLVLPALSLIVAAAAVYLLLRFSPFSWPQKSLLVLGVFPVFEYSVVARNYGLGMLLIVILAMLYPTRLQRPVWWGILLALLANTSIHAAIIAVAVMAGTGWDLLVAWRAGVSRPTGQLRPRRVWLGATIAVAGLIAARATVSTHRLPNESGEMPRVRTVAHQMALSALNPGRFLGALVPSPTDELANTYRQVSPSTPQAIVIDVILLLMVAGLWGEWSLLLIMITAFGASGALFRTVYGAYMRHLGLLWFLLILVYWQLARRQRPGADLPGSQRRRLLWFVTLPLTAVMLLQAIEGVRRVRQDVTTSLSSSAAMGRLLQEPEYRDATVLSSGDNLLEALPYYGARRLYLHSQLRYDTHRRFDFPFHGDRSLLALVTVVDSLGRVIRGPILILVPDSAMARAPEQVAARLRASTVAIANLAPAVSDESYRVYRLRTAADTMPGSTQHQP